MTTAADIAKNLRFDKIDSQKTPNLISYSLLNHANGDTWKEIKVVFNGADHAQTVNVRKGDWKIVAQDGRLSAAGDLGATAGGKITLAPYTALILAEE